jgi:hypothetical protein
VESKTRDTSNEKLLVDKRKRLKTIESNLEPREEPEVKIEVIEISSSEEGNSSSDEEPSLSQHTIRKKGIWKRILGRDEYRAPSLGDTQNASDESSGETEVMPVKPKTKKRKRRKKRKSGDKAEGEKTVEEPIDKRDEFMEASEVNPPDEPNENSNIIKVVNGWLGTDVVENFNKHPSHSENEAPINTCINETVNPIPESESLAEPSTSHKSGEEPILEERNLIISEVVKYKHKKLSKKTTTVRGRPRLRLLNPRPPSPQSSSSEDPSEPTENSDIPNYKHKKLSYSGSCPSSDKEVDESFLNYKHKKLSRKGSVLGNSSEECVLGHNVLETSSEHEDGSKADDLDPPSRTTSANDTSTVFSTENQSEEEEEIEVEDECDISERWNLAMSRTQAPSYVPQFYIAPVPNVNLFLDARYQAWRTYDMTPNSWQPNPPAPSTSRRRPSNEDIGGMYTQCKRPFR